MATIMSTVANGNNHTFGGNNVPKIQIETIRGLSVAEAVITRGRSQGQIDATTWGLRPKMQIIFTLTEENNDVDRWDGATTAAALQEQSPPPPPFGVWFKGTVKPLPPSTPNKGGDDAPAENDDDQIQEFSYQELKYLDISNDSEHWRTQFELEKSKWKYPILEAWTDFVKMRTFWHFIDTTEEDDDDDSDGAENLNKKNLYAFDYYPCSFWLEEGYTHSKMEILLQIESSTSDELVHAAEPVATEWSKPFIWNTRQCYRSSKDEIMKRLVDMRDIQHLNLDGYSEDLITRLAQA